MENYKQKGVKNENFVKVKEEILPDNKYIVYLLPILLIVVSNILLGIFTWQFSLLKYMISSLVLNVIIIIVAAYLQDYLETKI